MKSLRLLPLLFIILTQCQNNTSPEQRPDSQYYCHKLLLNEDSNMYFHLCFGKEVCLYYSQDGHKEGICVYYYKSGNLMQIDSFLSGERNGICKSFWPNGKINKFLHFQNGLQHGEVLALDSIGRLLDYSIQRNGFAYYIEKNEYDSRGKYLSTVTTVIPNITYQNTQPCNECPLNFEILLKKGVPYDKYILRYHIMKKNNKQNFKYPFPPNRIICSKKDHIGYFKYEGPGEYIVYGEIDLRKDSTVGRSFEETFQVE